MNTASITALNPVQKNLTDKRERLYYLSASTIDLCSNMLRRILASARQGKFGDTVRQVVPNQTADRNFANSVKELSVAFSYLILFDNGGKLMDEQSYELVESTFYAIDQLVVGVSAKEILLVNAQAVGYEICDVIAESVAKQLGASPSKEFQSIIAEFLRQSYSLRKDLLKETLSLSSAEINRICAGSLQAAA